MGGGALDGILDDCIANKAFAVLQALSLRGAGEKIAAQGHSNIVGLRDPEQREHAFSICGGSSGSQHFLSEGEDPRFAGNENKTKARFATEPAGPCQAAMVELGFYSVARQGLVHHER